jgi:tetratricopeptide (TPR) repeat protein
LAQAVARLQESLVIRQELGDRRGEGSLLNGLGLAYLDGGRIEEARTCIQESLAIAREVHSANSEVDALDSLAGLLLQTGVLAEARPALACAQELAELGENTYTLAGVHGKWTRYWVAVARRKLPGDAARAPSPEEPEPGLTAQACLALARASAAKAGACAERLKAGTASEIGQEIVKARAAIAELEGELGLEGGADT